MYRPPQCTEREPDGTWEDCLWCSGDMLGNAAYGKQVYANSQSEYEGLRAESGRKFVEGQGGNITNLHDGMIHRWGWAGTVLNQPSWGTLWGVLKPGVGAVVQGLMGSVNANLRRWDPGFTGAHAIYVQREDAGNRVWWMNPEAPNSYPGEWVAADELRKYLAGLPGASAMSVIIGSRTTGGVPVPPYNGYGVTLKDIPDFPVKATNVTLYLPDGTVLQVPSLSSIAVAEAAITQSDGRSPSGSGWLKLGARPYAGYFITQAAVNYHPAPPPPPSAPADIAAFKARLKAAVNTTIDNTQ